MEFLALGIKCNRFCLRCVSFDDMKCVAADLVLETEKR